MTYNFPTSWRIEIKTIAELSIYLDVPESLLKKIYTNPKKYYHQKTIEKKGKFRLLTIPNKTLKSVQRVIHDKLFTFQFPPEVHGGIKGRSIKTNAYPHRQKKWVACLDIKDFYPSINFGRIGFVFKALGCSTEISKILTALTTYKFELPQGTPTSPILANLVLYNLDKRISALCRTRQISYTRFFDDISISGNKPLTSTLNKIEEFIRVEGFLAHKRKIKGTGEYQIITGLVVNGRNLKVSNTTLSEVNAALEKLLNNQLPEKELDALTQTIQGCIAFLKSVNSGQGIILETKFNKTLKKIGLV